MSTNLEGRLAELERQASAAESELSAAMSKMQSLESRAGGGTENQNYAGSRPSGDDGRAQAQAAEAKLERIASQAGELFNQLQSEERMYQNAYRTTQQVGGFSTDNKAAEGIVRGEAGGLAMKQAQRRKSLMDAVNALLRRLRNSKRGGSASPSPRRSGGFSVNVTPSNDYSGITQNVLTRYLQKNDYNRKKSYGSVLPETAKPAVSSGNYLSSLINNSARPERTPVYSSLMNHYQKNSTIFPADTYFGLARGAAGQTARAAGTVAKTAGNVILNTSETINDYFVKPVGKILHGSYRGIEWLVNSAYRR